MKYLASLYVILIFSLILNPAPAKAAPAAGLESTGGTDLRLIVRYRAGVTAAEIKAVRKQLGARAPVGALPALNAETIQASGRDGFIRPSEIGAAVIGIEPDYPVSVTVTPNDPYFAQAWGLARVQAPAAWDVTTGDSDVKIAILDTGIDTGHTDLSSKIIVSKNFTDSPTADDVYGHGTHVAGIAAAATGNGTGVASLGYDATLMNVKIINDKGAGYHSAIAQGIIWAADNGASVINLSMGGNAASTVLQEAVSYAWDKGVVIVAAAGNNGKTTPSYPAYYPEAIAVAATDGNDKLYSFSNRGDWVDVAAPGSAYSTVKGNGYGTMNGTSMASPYVAGLAGLLFTLAADENGDGKTNDEVRAAIEAGAEEVGTNDIGHGRINAYRSAQALKSAVPAPAAGKVSGSVKDAAGEAIAGATVSDGTRAATADDAGSYVLSGIPPGSYTLTAAASGYQAAARRLTFNPGQTLASNFILDPEPQQTAALHASQNATGGADVFYGGNWRAQTFTPAESFMVTRVRLPLVKEGGPAGDIIVSIRLTDAAGRPAGSDLASGRIKASMVAASWAEVWYDFDLGSGLSLAAGRRYAIVWRAPDADAAGPLYFLFDDGGAYGGGRLMAGSGGPDWDDMTPSWDAAFQVWGVRQDGR
ncbi:MAG: S8 family serine peptidase [Chloroflexi bacterium]|nr:S8 family serine peptidase [Chloroflexota bacterium]